MVDEGDLKTYQLGVVAEGMDWYIFMLFYVILLCILSENIRFLVFLLLKIQSFLVFLLLFRIFAEEFVT
jgi:hypothetical protein